MTLPVFAAFSLLQGILLLILFFLFLRQKTSSQGNPLKQGFWWFYGIFNFFFLSFFLSYLCSVSIFSRFTVTFREPEIIKRNRIKSGKKTCIWTFKCPFAHPLCIFLANSLVKTSLSGSSGILHYFYFFLSAFFSRRCIQHQVLFRHTFDKILL